MKAKQSCCFFNWMPLKIFYLLNVRFILLQQHISNLKKNPEDDNFSYVES